MATVNVIFNEASGHRYEVSRMLGQRVGLDVASGSTITVQIKVSTDQPASCSAARCLARRSLSASTLHKMQSKRELAKLRRQIRELEQLKQNQ